MITKQFGKDFNSDGGALTLDVSEISEVGHKYNVPQTRTHVDGWTIYGISHEDYYEWVNEFNASHPIYGNVWGDFEEKVFADSEEGFDHFYQNHQPHAWDYMDI